MKMVISRFMIPEQVMLQLYNEIELKTKGR